VLEDGGHDRAVVMDFGLAKERRADPAIAKLTATGIILGTPEFMSPEQIRGKPLDGRSDIYALGIVGFEMFTGKLPFRGRNAQEMMIARLRDQPVQLRQLRPDLSEKLERALGRALAANPDARYATALGSNVPIPRGAAVVDLSGYTVLPGFIDAHVHLVGHTLGDGDWYHARLVEAPAQLALLGAAHAQQTLEAGFTTVRVVGTAQF